MKSINAYRITKNTLAIIAIDPFRSKIIELDNSFIVQANATDIIAENCNYFGSSFLGRIEGSKTLIDCKHKMPIIISESHEIIFFPTSGPKNTKCSWILINGIEHFEKNDQNPIIYCKNNIEIPLETSSYILSNQILRASRLLMTLKKRKNEF